MKKLSKYVLVLAAVILFFALISMKFAVNSFHAAVPTIDTVSIATFNIQTFGQSKLNKSDVMEKIVDIIGRYDVVAVQEIRSKEQNVVPTLIDMLNASGKSYDYIISKRMGRTSSKEQYAFIYNTQNISYVNDSAFIVGDKDDMLHREPFVASFEVKNGTFDFTLVNIHTDPDEAKQELDYLDDVYRTVQDSDSEENDVILLGDLNTQGKRLYELGELSDIIVVVNDKSVMTNTRNNKQYDNIVFDSNTQTEYTGEYHVLSYEQEYGINMEEALHISDHKPVAAKFTRNGED
ncbi:endonuclease/exonuclease/phosphatase family protein [Candidatus Woesearchaeota archaeon]|nr:endonuclease/exonuclease/phosphatase family protein [Candidatus Woesearchaeota archaeon]